MVHENSDNGAMYRTPFDYREGRPLSGVMTLQNFVDGGYDVMGAKILVVVKSVGAKKKGEIVRLQVVSRLSDTSLVARKDGSTVENVNVHVQDDTAEATLGFWGTSTSTPAHTSTIFEINTDVEATVSNEGWKAGETVLLLQSPGCKIGHSVCDHQQSLTTID